MLDRLFRLTANGTTVRTELLAGLTTFLTMSYIIAVQPAVLTGALGMPPGWTSTGLQPGPVMVATCLAAALATAIMGLLARYPIAQAPGMGQNFFFVLTLLPAAAAMIADQVDAGTLQAGETAPWRVGLGVIFYSGVLFMGLSLMRVREALLDAISPSMRSGIAIGIGLFIAFIGLYNAQVLLPGSPLRLNPHFGSPDLIVFFFGLVVMACLHALRVPGSILLGMTSSTLLALAFRGFAHAWPQWGAIPIFRDSMLLTRFEPATRVIEMPPSLEPTFLQLDLVRSLSPPMIPFILIFLFMVLFDTLGTLIGVAEQAGLMKDGRLPRARRAFFSDAVASVIGATLGTSTVTSFVESAAGVEQGGRTGLTAVTVAVLFLLALFFTPLVSMVGTYPPITAPALVIVGSLMVQHVMKVEWSNFAESLPAFLIMIGIPLSFSIADGLALGFIVYPLVKLLSGQGRDVKWLMWALAAVLVAYFIFVRAGIG